MISFKQKMEEKEKSYAYLQGVEAFSANTTCPYVFGSKEFREWFDGYKDADFLNKLINDEL